MDAAVEGVGTTAVAAAAARALEATRDDALVRDEWAAALVEASGRSVPFPATWPRDLSQVSPLERSMLLGSSYLGLRTRFLDDELLEGGLAQIVILGSGLDTRAWRLDWPDGTTVFELDGSPVLALVARVLGGVAASARRVPIEADVTDPWASKILAHGFDPRRATHWVLEGLLPYLSAHDQAALLDDIVLLSAPGSRAVIERAVPIEDTPATRERLETFALATGLPMDEVLARTDPPDPVAVLEAAGWRAESRVLAELERRYDRPLRATGGSDAPSRGGFVTAVRPIV